MIRYRNVTLFPALAMAGTLLLAANPAAALEIADPAVLGVHPLRVAEGDGKKAKGAGSKEEAKRDIKAAPGKAKQDAGKMGGGIKDEFGKAKQDFRNPKKARKADRPKQEGA